MQQVNVINFVKHFCQMILNRKAVGLYQVEADLNRYMTLEICWIIANLLHGPAEIILDLLFDVD